MKFSSKENGLGDLLLFTSIFKYFPLKYTMQIPVSAQRFHILFKGLAHVEITDNIQPLQDLGQPYEHCAVQKLRNFIGNYALKTNHLPLVLYFDEDKNEKAIKILLGKKNPVIINPCCSPKWAETRNMPKDSVKDLIGHLKRQGRDIIYCSNSENRMNLDSIAEEIVDLDLATYIHLLRNCGFYCGANTGDMHLAAAVGCKCVVYNPKSGGGFNQSNWCYDHPNITNLTW